MGRHIIVALESVTEIRLSFGDDVVENVSKVGLHIGVGIFVDAKSRRSVLDEYVEQSSLRKSRKLAQYFVSDEVAASWLRF